MSTKKITITAAEHDLAAMTERWGQPSPEAMEWAQKALSGELVLPGNRDRQASQPAGFVTTALTGRVLDVPALIDLARRESQFMIALTIFARDTGQTLAVPALALAHASALLDEEERTELSWAMDMPHVVLVALSDPLVMGHVHQVALERGWPVVTSKTAQALWRSLGIDVVPLP